jgi:hypothetical protein
MYLRHTRSQNRDGSTVGYYAFAENVWNPNTQRSEAKVVHSFGRADQLDKAALERRSDRQIGDQLPVDPIAI